jgi:hypothetical protein
MMKFMPQLLYPRKEPQYPFIRRLGGPQSRHNHSGENKNLLLLSNQYSGHAIGRMVIWELIRKVLSQKINL